MTYHRYVTLFCGHCGHSIKVPVYCGNRFCSECSKSRSSRLRIRIRGIISGLKVKKTDSIKLLTLTVPRQGSLADGVELLVKSFRRLRQRAYFRNRVRGGAYFIEFKHNSDGWNPHLHILIESAFIPVDVISEHWKAVSPGFIVDIRRIPPGQAINYCTKYCTKLDLPELLQLQATEVLKNKRLFTVFGSWTGVQKSIRITETCCSECDSRDWCYNPYSNVTTWIRKQLYVHDHIRPREMPLPESDQFHLAI